MYVGSEPAARSLCDFLHRRGLDARILDDPNVFVRISSLGTYRYRVAVPDTAAPSARAALGDWRAFHAPRARALAGRVRRLFLASLLPPAAWWILHQSAPESLPAFSLEWALALWAASFVVVARLEHHLTPPPGP